MHNKTYDSSGNRIYARTYDFKDYEAPSESNFLTWVAGVIVGIVLLIILGWLDADKQEAILEQVRIAKSCEVSE